MHLIAQTDMWSLSLHLGSTLERPRGTKSQLNHVTVIASGRTLCPECLVIYWQAMFPTPGEWDPQTHAHMGICLIASVRYKGYVCMTVSRSVCQSVYGRQ